MPAGAGSPSSLTRELGIVFAIPRQFKPCDSRLSVTQHRSFEVEPPVFSARIVAQDSLSPLTTCAAKRQRELPESASISYD